MALPPATWTCEYKHDRRAHAHRCRCCRRVLVEGKQALMTRTVKGVIAIHAACADKQFADTAWLWRDAMECWGVEHQRAVGLKVAQHPMSLPPVARDNLIQERL